MKFIKNKSNQGSKRCTIKAIKHWKKIEKPGNAKTSHADWLVRSAL